MDNQYRLHKGVFSDDERSMLSSEPSASQLLFTPWRLNKSALKAKKFLRYMIVFRDFIVYLFAFWGIVNMVQQLPTAYEGHLKTLTAHNHKFEGCDCGNSVAEAMSLGCKFDALSMAWLPKHCRDDELTAEFDTTGKGPNGTWIYYGDTEHTVEISAAEVAEMGNDPSKRVHMDKDWHQTHCLYYWLKLHRTRLTGTIVEPRSDTEAHIRHCGKVFRKPGYGTISGVALNTNEAVEE